MTARLLLLAAALGLIGCSATPIHLPGDPDGALGVDIGDRPQPDAGPAADAHYPPAYDANENGDAWLPYGELGAQDAPDGDAADGVGDGPSEAGEGGALDAGADADMGDAAPTGDAEPDAQALDLGSSDAGAD